MDSHNTTFILVFIRIMSMLTFDVVFGSRLIPMKFRLLMALVLSFCVTSFITTPTISSLATIEGATLISTQVLIGVISAAVFQIIFQVMLVAGQFIATQSGLGFARLIDPNTEISVNVLSEFYYISAILLFISLNGHLMIVQFIINSFETIPLDMQHISIVKFPELIKLSSVMFSGGLSIALPTITALLVTNFSFGIMTRSAPQLNIFNVGLSITILVAFSVMFITFNSTLTVMQQQFENGFSVLKLIERGLAQ